MPFTMYAGVLFVHVPYMHGNSVQTQCIFVKYSYSLFF